QGRNLRMGGSEGSLSLQAGLEAVSQVKPLLGGRRSETAERADDPLARTFGGVDGLDEEVVGVALALVILGGFADVHRTLDIRFHQPVSREIFNNIRHYFEFAGCR